VHNARAIGVARVAAPVVLAGNAAAAAEAEDELARRRRHVVVTGNVLPAIGTLDPAPARAAIREVFLRHVIGGKIGKGLSPDDGFARLVRAATPDAVLTGVELLAAAGRAGGAGDVMVVDVGGATTDVYSVVSDDAPGLEGDVAPLRHARTVEGDLGLRSGARGVLAAAVAEGLLDDEAADRRLAAHAERAAADPGYLPEDPAADIRLAALAARVAARRHGRPQTPGGALRPLRDVGLLVGSGGVLRHHAAAAADVLGPLTRDHAGGWAVPERARVTVDRRYVLFAAGLLAGVAPEGAAALALDAGRGTIGK
jgi:uncharacterized protein (TIGR01319 family)